MAHVSDRSATDIDPCLRRYGAKELLRIITCGSVDDGKSTLIGRLLYESRLLFEDQPPAPADSEKRGTPGCGTDLASLADGQAGEHAQGITTDVAYRLFSTDRRKFIVADAPGHEQYTRNFVTNASTADLAVVVVDARRGVLTQTRRHSFIVALLGIRHVVLAVNKMDLVGYDESTYRSIVDGWGQFARPLRFQTVVPIPMSALDGANVVQPGVAMPWFRGSTLMAHLESVPIDASRTPRVITVSQTPSGAADQFEAAMVWMQEEPLFPGRAYSMKIGAQTVIATVTDIKYQVNLDTMEHLAAKKLELNGIAVCNIALNRPIAFDPHSANREAWSFVFVDRMSNGTAGAGMLHFALRRAHNLHVQHVDVDRGARSAMKQQKACVLWFTGLSGAGKSTISNLVEKSLHAMGKHTYLLDGDNVRLGLNKDLGFTEADRVENIRRVAEVAKLMVDAGLIVLTAFISPFRAEREMARALVRDGEFIEIHVDTPLSVAEARDRKGLYQKARRGELVNFTGIDSPYEVPEAPELRLAGAAATPEVLADQVIALMRQRGLLAR